MSIVLDASAVLVLLLDEPGADVVSDVLTNSVLTAVNLAEVLSKLTDRGAEVSGLADRLRAAGVLVEPMTQADAEKVAALRQMDDRRVLSFRRPVLPRARASARHAGADRGPRVVRDGLRRGDPASALIP